MAAGRPIRRGRTYCINVGGVFFILLEFVEKDFFCIGFTTEAFAASMMGTINDRSGNERYTDTLKIARGVLQTCRSTGRKRDNKVSLTSEIYLQCGATDAAAVARTNTVVMVSAI